MSVRLLLQWFGADPALAVVCHEARWADVPPDWLQGRSEYEDDDHAFGGRPGG